MSTIKKRLVGEKDVFEFAKQLASFAYAGDIILLDGDLGSGKSTFARGFVRAMAGEKINVPSPTFTLLQLYEQTRLPIAHLDAYRFSSSEEIYELDLEPFFENGVVLIEWPSKVEDALPKRNTLDNFVMETEVGDSLYIKFTENDENSRDLELTATGSWESRLAVLDSSAFRVVSDDARKGFLIKNNIDFSEIKSLPVDCSFRTYHRFKNNGEYKLLMDSPPPVENVKPFINVAKTLKSIGIRVPDIYVKNEKEGYLLIEDFGDVSFSKGFENGEDKILWLKSAIDVLVTMVNSSANIQNIPRYSSSTPWAEASKFADWYLPYENLEKNGKILATHTADRKELEKIFSSLYKHVKKVPFVLCHWDYHIDNLIMCEKNADLNNVGVIDFQDAKIAPINFDISCLLEDRHLVPLTAKEKEYLINYFLDNLNYKIDNKDFMTSYRICLVHRIFKIFGLYMKQKYTRGREQFPWNLEHLWKTVNECLEDPALMELKSFLHKSSFVKSKAS